VFASGLTDPDLSLAASIHLFAWAGLEFPPRSTGRSTRRRGTSDRLSAPWRDRARLPEGPGLGVTMDARA
jgi:muconate cycloisomerase